MKQSTVRKLVSLGLVVVLIIGFSLTTTSFLSFNNFFNLFREVSVIGLISVGVTFVIIGGGIDISTGAIMGLSAMVAARLVDGTLWPIWLIVLIALLVGVACGTVNGLLVTKLNLSEFIATFGTLFIFRSLVYVLSFREDGFLITKMITDPYFLKIGGTFNGFYYMTLVWLLVVLMGYVLIKKTVLGTYICAIGSDKKAARMSGINVDRIKILTFVLSGLCSALAGVLLLAWQGSVALSSGQGMEFQAIAAVVIGGVALTGGKGDTIGTALGSVFMVMVVNGLYKYNLPTEFQTIAYGAIIIIMSMFDVIYTKRLRDRNTKKKEVTPNG